MPLLDIIVLLATFCESFLLQGDDIGTFAQMGGVELLCQLLDMRNLPFFFEHSTAAATMGNLLHHLCSYRGPNVSDHHFPPGMRGNLDLPLDDDRRIEPLLTHGNDYRRRE